MPLKVIQQLAGNAGFANWSLAQQHIQEIVEIIASFAELAKGYDVHASTIKSI